VNQPEFSTFGQTIQATFDRLEGCLEQAESLVPVATVDKLIELLPSASIESQRFILAELIKLDMGTAAELGQLRMLDFYLPKCGRWLSEFDIPLDLVLEELQIRRDSGQNPTLAEYQQRFPRWAGALAEFPWEQISNRREEPLSGIPELEVGQYIDDFRVVRTLGRGAFAQVYLATQESMNRVVALKISSRGSDEPRTLSMLDHPNIVRVFDQRQLGLGKVHLLYMQAVLGGTLAAIVTNTRDMPLADLNGKVLLNLIDQSLIAAGQQPPEREDEHELASMSWAESVVWLGWQLAEGLQSAHDHGIYHRDVKPANILLTAEGRPKLADFNVSHNSSDGAKGAIGGTLAYMSPEQLIAVDTESNAVPIEVGARADLYSLAVVLWELWQGQRPWNTPSPSQTWHAAVEQQLSLRAAKQLIRREDASPEGQWLRRVLVQSLNPDFQLRPHSCSEMAMRLKLAMHPKLAARFAPSPGSFIGKLRNYSVVLVVTVLALLPNGIAGILNYLYNLLAIINHYADSSPDLVDDFNLIATWINSIAFSLGTIALIYFCWRVRRSLNRAEANLPATKVDLDWLWRFGHRAALIGAGLWISFGLIFPFIIRWNQPEFGGSDFTHFFLSLAISGGLAWIYPYYGVSLLSTIVYYPALMSPSMVDPDYSSRAEWMRRWSNFYLASSAVIPLLSIGLIISISDSRVPTSLKMMLVVLTFLSIVFSFRAYEWLNRVIEDYEPIFGQLGKRR
jgi:eukaryotic-like serine/threonine-protein kinase